MIDSVPQVIPYEHFAFDVETANGRPEEAESWMRRIWRPDARWKPETIGNRFVLAFEKKKERLALLDSSPIIAIAIAAKLDLRCLHAMGEHAPRELAGGLVEGFVDERAMLTAFRNLVEACVGPDTCLVGHNIIRFDLPKIRHAFVRSGLRLPTALIAREQPLFDSMREFGRFSLDERPFVSVADLLDIFGIPSHKAIVDGALVPELYERGETEVIVEYAMLDVLAEYRLFFRMTGQAADVEPGSNAGPDAGDVPTDQAGTTDPGEAETPAGNAVQPAAATSTVEPTTDKDEPLF